MEIIIALLTFMLTVMITITYYLIKKARQIQQLTLYNALEQTKTPSLILDKNNNITKITDDACKLLELGIDDVIGKPICKIFNNKDCPKVQQTIKKLETSPFETLDNITIDTTSGHCHVFCKFSIIDSIFKRNHKIVIFHDRTRLIDSINNLEKSEKKLNKISHLFKSSFNDSFVPSIIIKEDGTITNYNSSFFSLIRKQPINLNNDNLFELLQIDKMSFLNGLKNEYSFETLARINNTPRSFVFNLNRITSEHENFILCQVQDITKHKQAEVLRKKLEKQVKNTRKVEYLGELAGIMSHEFNNALMPILSFSTSVKNNLPVELKDEKTKIEKVILAAEHVKDMINKIMEIKHIDFHEKERVNLPEVISNTINDTDIPKNITLKTNKLTPEIEVFANNEVLQKALNSLLLNSIESIDSKNGEIVISVSDSKYEDLEFIPKSINNHKIKLNKKYTRLEVFDNGTGISEQDMENIFNPFFTTKHFNKQIGTGLTYFFNCTEKYKLPFTINNTKSGVSFIIFFEQP